MLLVTALLLLILAAGFLTTEYFFQHAPLPEKTGFTVFFSLTCLPFLAVNLSLWLNYYINLWLILSFSCLYVTVFFCLVYFRHEINRVTLTFERICSELKRRWLFLFLILLTGMVSFFYYSNEAFILSLGSYVLRGEADCFAMQTFRLYGLLNPQGYSERLVPAVSAIINTPGNTLFTAPFLPLLKLATFKAVYISFAILLFIFVYLILQRMFLPDIIACLGACFAIFNPYVLSIEVLDRNVINLALSAVFIYTIFFHKNKVILHGLMFGIMAGTGLRFLSLLCLIPVLFWYYREEKGAKDYMLFFVAGLFTFSFNIPHLMHHGFQSLGETRSSLSLLKESFTRWMRTPFVPFPNLLFYTVNIINYFGYLISAIILFGLGSVFGRDRKKALFLLSFFLAVLGVLSVQRNWIQSDKYRIIVTAFLPLYVFFACGAESLIRRMNMKKIGLFALNLLFLFGCIRFAASLDFPQDKSFYERYPLYQTESHAYYRLARGTVSQTPFLPNYRRLFTKLDFTHKRKKEQLALNQLFPPHNLPRYTRFKEFYSQWDVLGNHKCPFSSPGKDSKPREVYIKINFEKLCNDIQDAIRIIPHEELPAIDLVNREELYDLYYTDLEVTWQAESLPVCVFIDPKKIDYLKTCTIDLNAFSSSGNNSFGLDVVSPIRVHSPDSPRHSARQPALPAFPLLHQQQSIVIRIPDDMKVLIHNWFVNGEDGASYRRDSWCIQRDKGGEFSIHFFYGEPESYL